VRWTNLSREFHEINGAATEKGNIPTKTEYSGTEILFFQALILITLPLFFGRTKPLKWFRM